MLYRYLCITAKVNTQSSRIQSFVYSTRNNLFTALWIINKAKIKPLSSETPFWMLSTALYWEHNQGKPLFYYISLVSKKDKKADVIKMEFQDGIFKFDTPNIWKPLYKEGNCCIKCSGEMQLNERQESWKQHRKGQRLKKTLHSTQNLI